MHFTVCADGICSLGEGRASSQKPDGSYPRQKNFCGMSCCANTGGIEGFGLLALPVSSRAAACRGEATEADGVTARRSGCMGVGVWRSLGATTPQHPCERGCPCRAVTTAHFCLFALSVPFWIPADLLLFKRFLLPRRIPAEAGAGRDPRAGCWLPQASSHGCGATSAVSALSARQPPAAQHPSWSWHGRGRNEAKLLPRRFTGACGQRRGKQNSLCVQLGDPGCQRPSSKERGSSEAACLGPAVHPGETRHVPQQRRKGTASSYLLLQSVPRPSRGWHSVSAQY